MALRILSAASLSPQGFFDRPTEFERKYFEANRLTATEPDYSAWIDARKMRRMSRVIRMGAATALAALRGAGTDMPDAVITGTAFGCLEDTDQFLTSIFVQHEQLLNPTPFIQSTHNTVAAQIALLLKCHNYNNTFVHGAFSFESALMDAWLHIQEMPKQRILAGSIDELTDNSFTVHSRAGLYRQGPVDTSRLFEPGLHGTIAGEGSAFLVLSGEDTGNGIGNIEAFETLYDPAEEKDVNEWITRFLQQHGGILPDLVLTGDNGDSVDDAVYETLRQGVFKGMKTEPFKQLSGEFPTAVSYACWLACARIASGSTKAVLIYNHYMRRHHSLILISA